MNELYPFAGRFLYLDGIRYHYLDEGSGDPLILLHGNPTWSFFYRNLIPSLRANHRVIAPDHIGCGLSDKPGDARYDYTLARRVQGLEFLLEHLALDRKLTLIVHDWGGMIGLAYAVKHPDRIARLVVMNTAAFNLPQRSCLPWQLRLARSWLGPLLVRGLNLFSRGTVKRCSVRPLPPEVQAGYLKPYDSWHNRIAVHRFVQDIPVSPADRSYALLDETQRGLERLRALPMLICWGERDFVFDPRFLEEWQRRFPEAEVQRYPDAGHLILEDAGDEISLRIRAFLQAHPLNLANAATMR